MWLWLEDIAAGVRYHVGRRVRESKGKRGGEYFEDILVYSADLDYHLALVPEVLFFLQAGGISVNFAPSK